MKLAPIALFVFNRPEHSLKTLEAISKNELADQTTIYIFADGPKENADEGTLDSIKMTRDIIRSRKWCKETIIIERDTNLGLSQSVYSGVSVILEQYNNIIVLEDDIVTSTFFLKYMNEALDLYNEEDMVFQISGFMIPNNQNLPGTFFYRAPTSWGWGTWKRAWKHYIDDAAILKNELEKRDIARFNIEGSYDYLPLLTVWDVRWYASIFLKNGLCLWPARSLVRNIGHDGSGHNCDSKPYYLNQKIFTQYSLVKQPVSENVKALAMFKSFYTDRYGFLEEQKTGSNIFRRFKHLKNFLKTQIKKVK